MPLSSMKGLPILMKHSKYHRQYWHVSCKLFMITAGVSIPSIKPWTGHMAMPVPLSISMSLHPNLKDMYLTRAQGIISILQVHLSEL